LNWFDVLFYSFKRTASRKSVFFAKFQNFLVAFVQSTGLAESCKSEEAGFIVNEKSFHHKEHRKIRHEIEILKANQHASYV
jgi:hypothetical protein